MPVDPLPVWSVLVPVRGTAGSKSRLDVDPARRERLALALALDTIAAVHGAERVARVVVVTAAVAAARFRDAGAEVVVEAAPSGLADAIARGLGVLDADVPRAVLLGDVPALTAAELDDALAAAERVDRGVVADADGTGTVLLTARAGVAHDARFGMGSHARHLAAGYLDLPVPSGSGLRRDVDVLADLEAVRALGPGPATRAVLEEPAPSRP